LDNGSISGVTSFSVDPDKLDDLAHRLSSVRSRLSEGPRAGMSAGHWPGAVTSLVTSVGWDPLEAKLQDFCRRWSDGLADMHEYLDETIDRLQASARDYRTSDAEVSRAIQSPEPGAGG
jgi:hypothetical protein